MHDTCTEQCYHPGIVGAWIPPYSSKKIQTYTKIIQKTHSDTWRAYIQFQRDAYAIQPKQVMTVRRGRSPSKFPNPGPHQSHKIGCDMDSVALWNPAVSSQKTLFNPLVRTLACSTRLPFLYTMRLPMLCRDLSKKFSDSSVGRLSTSGPRNGRT